MEQTYTTRSVGQPNTADHRMYMETSGQAISAFHDVALYVDPSKTILNMVVTVPRWTNAKFQVCKEEQLNPIGQQVRKGKLRYVRNCFPHHGYIWNYGYFPQTWEDPTSFHPETKAKGDNNPLDICEIGEQIGYMGQVKQVKVLGIMSLLDEDQTDWKVIVIDVKDPFAPKLNDVEDVERHLPGLLRATNEWFRVHEIPDGKPEKQFAFTGECKNRNYAMDIIRECHESWNKLVRTTAPPADVNTTNLTVPQGALRVAPNEITQIPAHQDIAPAVKSSSVDKWFFFSGGWQ